MGKGILIASAEHSGEEMPLETSGGQDCSLHLINRGSGRGDKDVPALGFLFRLWAFCGKCVISGGGVWVRHGTQKQTWLTECVVAFQHCLKSLSVPLYNDSW